MSTIPSVREYGPVIEGTQHLELRIDSGRFKGEVQESINSIIGKKELDKVFEPGDRAYVVLDLNEAEDTIVYANVIDHYRSAKTLALLLLFFITLFAVAGWIGLKSIISFIFTGIILLKVLLPLFLHGFNPILTAAVVVTILTGGIIFLVGGDLTKGSHSLYRFVRRCPRNRGPGCCKYTLVRTERSNQPLP